MFRESLFLRQLYLYIPRVNGGTFVIESREMFAYDLYCVEIHKVLV